MHRRTLLRLFLAMSASAGVACTKKQKDPLPPKTPAPAPATRTPTPPVAAHDLTGRPRAKPRPTMGALEAEPGVPAPRKDRKKPPRKDAAHGPD